MKALVLGSAAGGGLPQWNCACAGCTTARRTGVRRTQDTVAITGDGSAWFLLNASPDLRTQIVAARDLDPGPGPRDTPIRGVLLTTAEIDHTAGLLSLREAGRLTVYGTATVLDALHTGLPLLPVLRRYTDLDVRPLPTTQPLLLDGGLTVRALVVGAKAPRYADDGGGGEDGDWVSALRITDDRTGRSLVYATCLPAWTDAFDDFLKGADTALLDGTFLTEDEMARGTGLSRTPRQMGHLPIVDALPSLRRHPELRALFGHLNNTNPAAVAAAFVDVAMDDQTIEC